MYWIFLPSFLIALLYFWLKSISYGIFEDFHLHDTLVLFGLEFDVKSYLSNVEWFYYLILFEVFKFTLLIILSPFNALISEIYDQKLTGNIFKFSFTRVLSDLVRGLLIGVSGFALEMFLSAFWLLASLLLPLESLTPFFFLAIASFFYGFGYIDYSLERHKIGGFQSWFFAFDNFKTCFSIGLVFSLFMYIPIAGVILAPPFITLFATHHYLKIKG